MGIINKERFVELAQLPISAGVLQWVAERSGKPLPVDRERALDIYDFLKESVLNYGSWQDKSLRPWTIDASVIDSLDQNQPWWGWEFETGYVSRDARAQVLEHVWDTWDNMCFDGEGDGSWMSEVTFAPEALNTYEKGESKAQQFIEYLESVPELIYNSGAAFVGTHFNLSLPEFRGGYTGLDSHVASVLNNTLHHASEEGAPFHKYFGRDRLYGGFFNHGTWIEGKLFRTTYSTEVFKEYLRVAKVLTNIAQEAVKHSSIRQRGLYASNALELLAGETTQIEWNVNPEYSGWNYGDYVSSGAGYPDNDYGDDYDDYDEDSDYDEEESDEPCNCVWCSSVRAA